MATVSKRTWTHKGVAATAWVVRYKDENGRRRSKQFDLKKQADAYRQHVEREQHTGAHIPDAESPLMKEVARQFLEENARRLTDGRIGRGRHNAIASVVNLYVIPALGHVRANKLAWADCVRLRDLIEARGVAHFTLRRHLTNAVMVEAYARRRGWAVKRVLEDYRKELGTVPKARIRTLTLEEMVSVIRDVETPRKHAKRRSAALTRCWVHLAAFCTMRWGEIAGLTIDDVDLTARVVRIRHGLTDFDEHKGPKTRAGIRDVPLPLHLVPILRDWIETYYAPNDRRLMFRKSDGGQLTPSNWRNAHWYPLLYRVGLNTPEDKSKVHFHAIRHFAASLMVERHLPLSEIAPLMGHAKFDITLQTYVHPIVGGRRQSEAFDAVAAHTMMLTDATAAQRVLTH